GTGGTVYNSTDAPTNAGSYLASATFAGSDLYSGSSGNAPFTISPASSITTVTCPPSVTYTGAAQTPCSLSETGANPSLTPAPTYSNNTNAGTATASYTYVPDANHTGSSDSKPFTIGPASSTTTVTCQAGPFVYTGAAQTPCSVSVTGA